MRTEFLKLMIKAQLATLGFLLLLFLITGLVLSLIGWRQFSIFQKASTLTTKELYSLAQTAWQSESLANGETQTILLLGLDEIASRDQTALTDTLMLVTINTTTGQINLLSLPRDLWVDEYETKVNALYYYSKQNDPDKPTEFVAQAIESITGVTIDRVLSITLEQLAEVVDLVNGLEIDVPTAFVDQHFPRAGVDPSVESDPNILQETIIFEKGKQVLSGARVLKYVRSRQAEGDAGSDNSRTQRQQQVLMALLDRVQSKDVVTNPKIVGGLVAWFRQNYEQQWPLSELVTLGIHFGQNGLRPTVTTRSLPIAPKDTTPGILVHPPVWRYQNQWVYIATDSAIFKTYIQEALYRSK